MLSPTPGADDTAPSDGPLPAPLATALQDGDVTADLAGRLAAYWPAPPPLGPTPAPRPQPRPRPSEQACDAISALRHVRTSAAVLEGALHLAQVLLHRPGEDPYLREAAEGLAAANPQYLPVDQARLLRVVPEPRTTRSDLAVRPGPAISLGAGTGDRRSGRWPGHPGPLFEKWLQKAESSRK
ncbi:hypothetical protein J2S46_000008 [Kitasatospora herbaricolor]|uniref:hypothetical protein n=1 Tax=Kitasatospora herbaricolor TaxID=68217 RepID=UPI0017498012|nr:hypothetical protein [Kitasatospora herbaricolor]MDQ0305452.1 hypothetical protein [Kitasatospora herbaricolor]